MRQHLKNNVSIPCAIPMPAQSRQAQCVSGVVGEIESTFQGIGAVGRVLQASESRSLQTCEFLCVRWLRLQTLARSTKSLKWRGHSHVLSAIASVAPSHA